MTMHTGPQAAALDSAALADQRKALARLDRLRFLLALPWTSICVAVLTVLARFVINDFVPSWTESILPTQIGIALLALASMVGAGFALFLTWWVALGDGTPGSGSRRCSGCGFPSLAWPVPLGVSCSECGESRFTDRAPLFPMWGRIVICAIHVVEALVLGGFGLLLLQVLSMPTAPV